VGISSIDLVDCGFRLSTSGREMSMYATPPPIARNPAECILASMKSATPLVTFIIFALANGANAQAISQRPRAFDVCSVKPSPLGSPSTWRPAPDGRFTATAVPIVSLVVVGFGIEDFQVSGLPSWATSDRYDVSCKDTETADANEINEQRLRSGLQALLADRFRFQYHRSERRLPVATLRVGKSGLKVKPSKDSTPGGSYGPTFLKAKAWSMARLADVVTKLTGERVLDQTGAADNFDFDLEWNMDEQDARVAPGAIVKRPALPDVPLMTNVLNERLGLTITREMQNTEIIIVDHIEKPGGN
jgi:bla regulator protein blaR1